LSILTFYRQVDGFDVLFLSDLLWYSTEHEALVEAIAGLLARSGQAWIGCGEYTTMDTCQRFMYLAEKRGLTSRRIQLGDDWQGTQICSLHNLRERKRRVCLWQMEWA
jgi:hypothetical protein